MSMSFCLSICLSAHIGLTRMAELHEIFCACCLWPWLGLHMITFQYVMYFWFYEWRHFFIPWGNDVMFGRAHHFMISGKCSVWLSSSECGTRGEVLSMVAVNVGWWMSVECVGTKDQTLVCHEWYLASVTVCGLVCLSVCLHVHISYSKMA